MKKWLRRIAALLLLLCVLTVGGALLLNAHVVSVGKERLLSDDLPPPQNLDCILVLGCSVYRDGTPSPMLKDRLELAVSLYEKGWSQTLLLSGDNGSPDYNEVAAMKQQVLALGVPVDAIVLDYAGFSTYDSIYRARDIFGVRRMAVVTQSYHLYRALYLAQALSVEAWGVPSDQHTYAGQDLRELREIAARNKDVLFALIKPKPTYLGEPVALPGAGGP